MAIAITRYSTKNMYIQHVIDLVRHMLSHGQIDYLIKKEKHHEKIRYRSNRSPRCNVHQHDRFCSDQNTD
jgi:hypothetical protein